MDKFYIDRQFGLPIWIDVENGIVQKCYNEEPKFIKRMHELYKGRSISFLKEDFENRMRPSYHNVRCATTVSLIQNITAVNSRIKKINYELSNIFLKEEAKPLLEKKREELFAERYNYETQLEEEKDRIKKEHNYNHI